MKRFSDILCVVEPEHAAQPALERAVSLAESNQAALTVISVVPRVTAGIGMPEGGPISKELQTTLVDVETGRVKALLAPYRDRLAIRARVLTGTPFLEVIRTVLRNGHDLVIKVPERQDWLDRLFGSDDMHLMRKCPCPVWMIKPRAPHTYRRILAAIDFDEMGSEDLPGQSDLNRQIVDMAGSHALADFAELHVVHVWDAVGENLMRHGAFARVPEDEVLAYVENVRGEHEDRLDDLLEELLSPSEADALHYLEPTKHLVKGWAREEIPRLAHEIEADLVVMGTVARSGIPGLFMGNTAETILNRIDCSVMAIKPPGFRTPVTLDG